MDFKKIIILCSFVAVNFFPLFAQDNIKAVLEEANRFSIHVPFSATKILKGGRSEIIEDYWQKRTEDGSWLYRSEHEITDGIQYTTLRNESGSYTVIGDVAILSPERVRSTESSKLGLSDLPDPTYNYSMETGSWQQLPCKIITKERNFLSKTTVTVYYIGIDNNFIYNEEVYDENGALLRTCSYIDVDFSTEVNDSLFVIPKTATVKKPTSSMEESELVRELLDNALGLPRLNEPNNVSNLVSRYSKIKYILTICLVSLLVVIIGLVIYKVFCAKKPTL